MPHLDGAHTHGDSGGGLGAPLAAGAGAVLVAAVLPVLLAVLNALAVALAIAAGVALAASAAFLAWRLRSLRAAPATRAAHPSLWRPAAPAGLSAPRRRPAISAPAPALHIHLHGVSAEEIAGVIAQHGQPVRASIEEE